MWAPGMLHGSTSAPPARTLLDLVDVHR